MAIKNLEPADNIFLFRIEGFRGVRIVEGLKGENAIICNAPGKEFTLISRNGVGFIVWYDLNSSVQTNYGGGNFQTVYPGAQASQVNNPTAPVIQGGDNLKVTFNGKEIASVEPGENWEPDLVVAFPPDWNGEIEIKGMLTVVENLIPSIKAKKCNQFSQR
jgi:hypothetical protein